MSAPIAVKSKLLKILNEKFPSTFFLVRGEFEEDNEDGFLFFILWQDGPTWAAGNQAIAAIAKAEKHIPLILKRSYSDRVYYLGSKEIKGTDKNLEEELIRRTF